MVMKDKLLKNAQMTNFYGKRKIVLFLAIAIVVVSIIGIATYIVSSNAHSNNLSLHAEEENKEEQVNINFLHFETFEK